MSKITFKLGQKALTSRRYKILGSKGRKTRVECTVIKNEPLPPTLQFGQSYVLVDKTKTR
jgi:hypothetical protein